MRSQPRKSKCRSATRRAMDRRPASVMPLRSLKSTARSNAAQLAGHRVVLLHVSVCFSTFPCAITSWLWKNVTPKVNQSKQRFSVPTEGKNKTRTAKKKCQNLQKRVGEHETVTPNLKMGRNPPQVKERDVKGKKDEKVSRSPSKAKTRKAFRRIENEIENRIRRNRSSSCNVRRRYHMHFFFLFNQKGFPNHHITGEKMIASCLIISEQL